MQSFMADKLAQPAPRAALPGCGGGTAAQFSFAILLRDFGRTA
jgi:hypothetical protein